MSFTFLLNSLISSPSVMSVVPMVWVYFVAQVVPYIMHFSYPVLLVLSLVAPFAFSLGMVRIFSMELKYIGVTFENIQDGNFSVLDSIIMLTVDSFLYW